MFDSEVLLGIIWQGGPSYHKVHRPSGTADICPGIFIFTKFIVHNLGYLILLDSHPFLILTPWGSEWFYTLTVLWFPSMLLRGIPSILPSLWRFGRVSKIVCGTWCLFLRNRLLRIYPILIVLIPIVARLPRPFGWYCLIEFLWDHIYPMVPFW